jgi:AraC-like DNA-binding protein
VDEEGTAFHRIYYVYGGESTYEDSEQRITLKPSHLYIFPTNKKYTLKHNPQKPLECLWFHVILNPIILNSILEFSIVNASSIYYILKTLETAVGNNFDWILLTPVLESLIFSLSIKTDFFILKDKRLSKVIRYIHENYAVKLTNESLAKIINMDHFYFIRIFKTTFGVSPQKYVTSYKLSKAVTMLLNGMNVEDAAYNIGFTDSKAFSRSFKKNVGVSPSNYVKSHLYKP